MASEYQKQQRKKAIKLIEEKSEIFYGGKSEKEESGSGHKFILMDYKKNFYQPIKEEVIEYFKQNNISWWGVKKGQPQQPTGHALSSQIACLNHLFALRKDKQAVLSLLKSVSDDFTDVCEISTDKYNSAFIQFESVSDKDHLNERKPSRGSYCTSIDALIYAKHKDGTKWLIPIEWKYTESYSDGQERYADLIDESNQLKSEDHFCYYFEPFYQLMRQTLWAEQMVKNKGTETIKADNYLHLHIIPSENKELLTKTYKCNGLDLDMESTWRNHLKDDAKYIIISPEDFLQNIDKEKYKGLIDYLKVRYW
jgi:hypothetical protein